ncbi:hypothetical protein K505DRAFT_360923 [Melanomma pulvis-pyrius CBS 109.77]|uniref:Uncharacterized protein n=1 Tax=Melanomma pulvis-pyrius CBS 109.77 TaxID=1314802 RepID=A0A6A6XE58_9PLEO|nr:hypothetical protein K505DRAFT_360923 [Melanomma pulvis-pyrius CBS 109.77]
MNKILVVSTAVALATTSIYFFRLQNYLSPVRTHQISSSPSIPDTLRRSRATSVVNPNDHVSVNDTRSITLQLHRSLSDEEILALFVKGFFGGYVFGPERGMLRAVGRVITRFDRLRDAPVSSYIWSAAQISTHAAPPLHAVLFGAFRVVDCHFQNTCVPASLSAPASARGLSYIDFAFGSDDGGLAGVHRFSVVRDGAGDDVAGAECVTIEFAHTGCNPKVDKPLGPYVLQSLHLLYAMLLFREGVVEVMRA